MKGRSATRCWAANYSPIKGSEIHRDSSLHPFLNKSQRHPQIVKRLRRIQTSPSIRHNEENSLIYQFTGLANAFARFETILNPLLFRRREAKEAGQQQHSRWDRPLLSVGQGGTIRFWPRRRKCDSPRGSGTFHCRLWLYSGVYTESGNKNSNLCCTRGKLAEGDR